MTVARTAAEVLEGHVTLEVESIDRMYLNLYVPQLQRELGVVGFFKQRGFAFASGAVMAPITNAFVAAIRAFVDERGVDLVRFKAGERKDDIASGTWLPRMGPSRCCSWGGGGQGTVVDHCQAPQS
jgi:hypothetical protein